MAEIFGERRKRLLRHLLRSKTGATVKELVRSLGITRTAVRQHLAVLMRDGYVVPRGVQPTGGRPQKLLVLTPEARETLARRYSWYGELVTEAVEPGRPTANARAALRRIAGAVVAEHGPRPAPDETLKSIDRLTAFMDRLGYDARSTRDADGAPAIEADNCIFHHLAKKHPIVCQFDLAVLSAYTGRHVALQECMVRGGRVCRFRFTSRPS